MGYKLSDLTTETLASGDMIPFVDVSDLRVSYLRGGNRGISGDNGNG